jgi:hypothetical protein
MNQLKEQMKQLNNRKYLIIAGCSYYWKIDKKNYPNDIPEAFLKGYAQVHIGASSSSIERIKESIIHTIGELLERGVNGSNIYLLSNITNIGRQFIKYPDYMLNSLSEYYKQENQIGKNIVSSLTLTANDEYKSKDVKRWEKNIISNIENSRLPIQYFEIYLESIVILQSFLKRNNISNTIFSMSNVFEGWDDNFNHTYSNLKGPVVPDLSKTLHIKDMSEYCKYLWDLIDLDNFVFHKTIGNNYGGIDEYTIDKFNGDESLYFSNPKEFGNNWYGNHPEAPAYSSFSDCYKISDKIINNLK